MAQRITSLHVTNVAPGKMGTNPFALSRASPRPRAAGRRMPGLPAAQRWQWQLGEAHQTAGQLSAGTYMLSPWPPARSAARGAAL